MFDLVLSFFFFFLFFFSFVLFLDMAMMTMDDDYEIDLHTYPLGFCLFDKLDMTITIMMDILCNQIIQMN